MKLIVKLFGLILTVVVLSCVIFSWYVFTLFQPVSPAPAEMVQFVVPKGQAISIIGTRLKEAELIRHPLIFRFVVSQQDLQEKIQAGSFELNPSMTTSEIAQALTKGTNDAWITIVEGWRNEEIAQMLEESDLSEFDKSEFLQLASGDEGYLFPDTYLLPRLATTETIYSLLRETFDKKVEVGLADEFEQFKPYRSQEYDFEDIITFASLVEREAKGYEQMRVVSGILWNRLEIDMALQVDATLQYVKGYNQIQKSWWVPPLAVDKELESPFNTYKKTGLPPRPICNPGLDAIKATLNPLSSDDLYYIHDRKGVIHTAKDLDGHNQNVDQYLK